MDEVTFGALAQVQKLSFQRHKHKHSKTGKVTPLGLTITAYITLDLSINDHTLKTRKIKFSTLLSSAEFKQYLKTANDAKE